MALTHGLSDSRSVCNHGAQLYIAYDTQKMIDEFEMGVDDHIKHATDLFIDFKIVFTRVMQLLMLSRDD